jgi:putative ABC transport system permease protein
VFSLIVGEAGLVTLTGVLTGAVLLYSLLVVVQPILATRFGLFFELGGITSYELIMGGVVCAAGILIGIIPGYRIYRYSLADGMTVRL